jgi:hypothetical protein
MAEGLTFLLMTSLPPISHLQMEQMDLTVQPICQSQALPNIVQRLLMQEA